MLIIQIFEICWIPNFQIQVTRFPEILLGRGRAGLGPWAGWAFGWAWCPENSKACCPCDQTGLASAETDETECQDGALNCNNHHIEGTHGRAAKERYCTVPVYLRRESILAESQHPAHKKNHLWVGKSRKLCRESFAPIFYVF